MKLKKKDQNQQQQLNVNVVEHYIKSISFDNYKFELSQPDVKPEIKMDIKVEVLPKEKSQYEVCLVFKTDIFADSTKIFSLNLNYAGRCILEGIIDESQKERILHVFCPNIIFPFARRVIADITRDGGFQPMLINHIDFAGMYNNKIEAKSDV